MTTGGVGRRQVVGLATLMGLAACASAPRPTAPAPISAPEVDNVAPSIALELDWAVLPEPGPVPDDEILGSHLMRDVEFQREVQRWVVFWRTTGARWFPEYLERMMLFSPTVDSALARRGLPPSLRYLPIIESGYSPKAVSRASAVGLWQFMAPTAQGYGMWVGPLLDERRNPFKSTEAAGDFLLALREQFGSWFLALAAYNSGPYRIQRVLDRYAPLAPRSDSLYWVVRPHLPRETRDFVPKFIAAAAVAQNPTAHGFENPADTLNFTFDEVVVPDATTLDVVAEAARAPQAEIERLNPEVVRGITPPGRTTTLRVPAGRGDAFEENYAKIPPSERVTFVEHRVVRGETLSHIARRYGVPLRELQAANPRVNPRRLQIGQRLTVPIAARAKTGS
jgi:membrane-bound lytic murein transglycosylase D